MDSLTQALLGASLSGVVAGRKYGAKAVIVGAICGTLPDLDVLIDNGDPVADFVMHRGFSHSLIVLTCLSPIIVWLLSRLIWFKGGYQDWRLHVGVFLALITHPLLDAMTIYGTQLYWPFKTPPAGLGSVFIIDPLYSLPLLLGVLLYFWRKSQKILLITLSISTLYLGWSVSAQYYIKNHIVFPQISQPEQVTTLVQPTALNTVLWRVVVRGESGYRVGYYSFFDQSRNIDFTFYPSRDDLYNDLILTRPMLRLLWFTKGMNAIRVVDGQVIVSDLRMGYEPDRYVFQFVLAREEEGSITPIIPEHYSYGPRDPNYLTRIWHRIWDENNDFRYDE